MSARPTLADWLRVRPDLRRVGGEHHGACPSCGGRDRFRVLDTGAAFCRQCAPAGDADGEAIKRLQHAAGLNGAAPVIRRLPLGADKLTAEHKIRDTAGKLMAVHKRFEGPLSKDMPWFQPNGTKGLGGLKKAGLPLYRSEDVPRAAQCTALVPWTGGEKACDALRAAEPALLVLGTVTAAGSIPAPEVLQTVVDAALPIYLWPDADDEGAKHMQRIGHVLHGAGAEPLVIGDAAPAMMPADEVPKGYDAANWAKCTDADNPPWSKLMERAAPWKPGPVPAATEPTAAPASTAQSRPGKNGIDAGEAALALAPSMRGCIMFATGRGWFTRGSVTALWRPADDATMLDRLQRSDTWWTCKRGTRTSAILGELTGPLRVDGALLDADDWTCGLPDGRVLDLRTGEVRAAVEADRITMALRAVPEPGEPLVWLRVLGDTFSYMDEPEAVLAYFRWWIRHALTGDCSAQRMAFLHGQSGTGKNTVADALLHLFDDYGQAIPAVHVVGRRDSHRAWIAQCDRKRYVLVGDLPEHGSWSTELHDMVGGADLNANFMRQNHFTFRSRAHVLATGNDAPRGQAGIWRRLAQYECRHKPTPPDTALKEKLEAEAGRILQWALDAPIAEPTMPAELRLAAEAVRDEQNPVRAWIRETWKGDPLGLTGSAAMFARYKARFHDVPERELLTETAFGRMVTGEFGPSRRKTVDGAQASIRQCVEV